MSKTKVCLYIESTDKVYKMFDNEHKAIEFLHLYEENHEPNTPSLELGECKEDVRILWSYPIHWDIINGIHLNDFETYERLLFMKDERGLPDRWEKFIKRDIWVDGKYDVGVYMPFDKPQTCHEYHLNHFVYWMVIGYFELQDKPLMFFDYNTGRKSFNIPNNFCWACAYDSTIGRLAKERKSFDYFFCDCCPIWKKDGYQCENDVNSPYHLWTYGIDKPENAIKLAKMPWRDLDDMVDRILY